MVYSDGTNQWPISGLDESIVQFRVRYVRVNFSLTFVIGEPQFWISRPGQNENKLFHKWINQKMTKKIMLDQ